MKNSRPLALLFVVSIALLGCGTTIEDNRDGGPSTNDGGPARDGGPRADAGPFDGGLRRCLSDLECPPTLVCLGNVCQPDPCLSATPCGEEDIRCRATCVALVDPCEGVVCGEGQSCLNGDCFPGCLPVVCEGVVCTDGQYCDPATGACAPVDPCDASCGDTEACHFTCTPRSACEGISCDEGQFCRSGECFDNPCFGVSCEAGEICQNGDCVATCDCDPMCDLPERCVANRCVCTPRCDPDAACGTDDGCGGFCIGSCGAANEECNPDTGVCDCIPSCGDAPTCGADDGCGGLCEGSCAETSERCVSGSCECTDTCVGASTITCGDEIPDTCTGSLACTGTGTSCDGSATCIEGGCCDQCERSSRVACGTPRADVIGEDGGVCRNCGGVGSACLGDLSCTPPPGSSAPEDRVCCGPCASASAITCGADIPDVLDADGNLCRTCSGFGTGGCDSGETCTGGATGVCCAGCESRNGVACGEEIPDLSCRTCSGYGRLCASGESCRNPPGTSGDAARVCCGSCPRSSTVMCGEDIPDVLGPDGSVCRTCGTGRSCDSGSCVSGSCCPWCPSTGSESCGVDIPDQVNGDGDVCRSCSVGTACGGGESCTGGVCCPGCASAGSLACGVDPVEPAGCAACPNGQDCPSGESCRSGSCCAPSCSAPSTRACGDRPSDGCGGTCSPGTRCDGMNEECMGSPLSCQCTPSCEGRTCGQSDGCGGECLGSCDPGFVCAERPDPAPPGDFQCEPSACVPSCGLCESCLFGACEPLTCAPGQSRCLATCECCAAGSTCTPSGCSDFG